MAVVHDIWGPVCNLCDEEMPVRYITNTMYTKEAQQWHCYHDSGRCSPPQIDQLDFVNHIDIKYQKRINLAFYGGQVPPIPGITWHTALGYIKLKEKQSLWQRIKKWLSQHISGTFLGQWFGIVKDAKRQ